jgi:hypothetical protein
MRGLFTCERGSATAEGVIVAPVLILLFAIAIWAYVRYSTASETVDHVRDAVWPAAVVGCDDGPRDGELTGVSYSFERDSRRKVPDLSPYYDEVRIETIAAHNTQYVRQPRPLGGRTAELGYRAETTCNTVPVDYSAELPNAMYRTFCTAVPYCDAYCDCPGGLPPGW